MFRSRSFILKSLQLVGMFIAVSASCGGGCGDDSMSPEVPESLELSPSSLSLQVGETGQFTAVVKGCDGRTLNESVDWSSSRSDIASVDVAGFVTGEASGSATVTASVPGLSRNASVSVTAGPGGGFDPTAAFGSSCTGLACQFTDRSSDADGTIEAWSWSFGDGASSILQNPSHTYLAAGTYVVHLTVTDDDQQTASMSTPVTVSTTPPPSASGQIVFVSNRSGGMRLYTMNSDGSGQSLLSDEPLAFSSEPEWSPDGSRIVFDNGERIRTVRADGSSLETVASGSAILNDPSYSPDGQQIAFRSNSTVYLMGADGSNRTAVHSLVSPEQGLAWWADGSSIWFSDVACAGIPAGQCGELDNRLFGVAPSGGTLSYLTGLVEFRPDYDHQQPAFSPDGQYLAFVTNLGGSRTIFLYDGASTTQLTSPSGSSWSPAWSPDSEKIVFVSDRDGNAEIYVMDRDGGNQQRLTNDPGSDTAPDWQ